MCVGNEHAGHIGKLPLGHDTGRAARDRLSAVVCAVLPRPMQGKEKASLSRCAGLKGKAPYLRFRIQTMELTAVQSA